MSNLAIFPEGRKMPARPCFAVYMVETVVDGKNYIPGTWYHGIKQGAGDDGGIPVDNWICAPLLVIAETINSEDGSVGRLIKFEYRGKTIEWVMPMEALAGKGEELLRILMRQGLTVDYHHRRLVPAYIASFYNLESVLKTTTKPGWHAATGAFVLPDRIIGSDKVRYQDSGNTARIYSQASTLDEWKRKVAEPCKGNPILVLSICCALAGPLLHRVGISGGGIHLVGDSSSGKSLAQMIAASIWGKPAEFATSWDITKGGIEIEASSRNDTILILDEIKRADPKRIQDMVYALANGVGKATMTRDREGRMKFTWRTITLSSGERSLSEHAAIAGNPAHAGAELRMVDVNAGTRRYRAFDELHGMTGQEFHRVLSEASSQHYGHAGIAFVEGLVKDGNPEQLIQKFVDIRKIFDVSNAQAGRVADRFAIIAQAGEIGIAYRLLPWEAGTAINTCHLLFKEWLLHVGDGNTEDRQILRSIGDFIDRYGDSRFSDIEEKKNLSVINNRAGYWEKEGDNRLYLFYRTGLKEAVPDYGLERVIRALDTAKAITKRDHGRSNKNYRLPNGTQARLYVIDTSKLENHACQNEGVEIPMSPSD